MAKAFTFGSVDFFIAATIFENCVKLPLKLLMA